VRLRRLPLVFDGTGITSNVFDARVKHAAKEYRSATKKSGGGMQQRKSRLGFGFKGRICFERGLFIYLRNDTAAAI
jgi:hypothetical protein